MARRYFYDRNKNPLGYVEDTRYYWNDGTLFGIRRGNEIISDGILGSVIYTLYHDGSVRKGVMGDYVCYVRSDGTIFNNSNPITQEIIGSIEFPQIAVNDKKAKEGTVAPPPPPPPPPGISFGTLAICGLIAIFLVFFGLFKLPSILPDMIDDMIEREAYLELLSMSIAILAVVIGATVGAIVVKKVSYLDRLLASFLGAWMIGYLTILVVGIASDGADGLTAMIIFGGLLVMALFAMLPALCISAIVHLVFLFRKK